MICQVCGVEAPTRSIVLHQHIGLIVIGITKDLKGELCRRCIDRYFRRFSLITLLCGWWGLHSLFLTPIFLGLNLIRFVRSRSLEPAPPDAQVPILDAAALKRLDRFRDYVSSQLGLGQTRAAVAQDVAMQAGTTPGQVYLFSLLVTPPLVKRRRGLAGWLRRAA